MGIQVSLSLSCRGLPVVLIVLDSPERWNNLPEAVRAQPGLYSNLMTFGAGSRVCLALKWLFFFRKNLSSHPLLLGRHVSE